jgi:hypothetical protein
MSVLATDLAQYNIVQLHALAMVVLGEHTNEQGPMRCLRLSMAV